MKKDLERQENCIKNYDKYEQKRAKFMAYISKRLYYSERELEEGRKGLFSDSDNYRTKMEQKKLVDLGATVMEKYGAVSGWKLGLRNNVEYSYHQKTNQSEKEEEET